MIVNEIRRRIDEPGLNIPRNVVELWRGGITEELATALKSEGKRKIGI